MLFGWHFAERTDRTMFQSERKSGDAPPTWLGIECSLMLVSVH